MEGKEYALSGDTLESSNMDIFKRVSSIEGGRSRLSNELFLKILNGVNCQINH